MPEQRPIDKILAALGDRVVSRRGRQIECRCPAHQDHRASLGVTDLPSGTVLMKCQAGCATKDVLAALGLREADLFPQDPDKPRIASTYDYRNVDGDLKYQVVRFCPKDFKVRQPRADGGWQWSLRGVDEMVPYRLPEFTATDKDSVLLVLEGEKACDRLWDAGFAATCSQGGAGKFYHTYAKYFAGRNVCILPDNDGPGEKHAAQVAAALRGVAASISVLRLPGLPKKGDIHDWFSAGGTPEEFVRLVSGASEFTPAEEPEAAVEAVEAPAAPAPPLDDLARAKLLLSGLGLTILSVDENGGFSLECTLTGKRRKFARMADVSFHNVLAIGGTTFKDAVAADVEQARREGRMSFGEFKDALALAMSDVGTTASETIGDGVWMLAPTDNPDARDVYVVADGKHYRYADDGLSHELGPVVRDTIIDTSSTRDWVDLEKLGEYLPRAADVEFRRHAFFELHEVLATWEWQAPCMAEQAASLVCATWMQSAWRWRPYVLLSGETNSGKSYMLEEFLRFLYLGAASLDAGATEASVRQGIRAAAMPVFIDEFDRNSSDGKIFNLLRGSGRKQSTGRGTSGGNRLKFFMRHIIWLSGISASIKDTADFNRFVDLELAPRKKGRSIVLPTLTVIRDLGLRILASVVAAAADAVRIEAEIKRNDKSGWATERWFESFAVVYAMIEAMTGDSRRDMVAEQTQAAVKSYETCGYGGTDADAVLEAIFSAVIRLPFQATHQETTVEAFIFQSSQAFQNIDNKVLTKYGIACVTSRTGDPRRIALRLPRLVGPQGALARTEFAGDHGIGRRLRRLPEKVVPEYKTVKFESSPAHCLVFGYDALVAYFASRGSDRRAEQGELFKEDE